MNDFAFVAAGNTTRDAGLRRFTYDAENKQTTVETVNSSGTVTGTIGEYFYDGDGRRVMKIAYLNNQVTETTIFVYDAYSRLVAEYSTILNPTPLVAYLTNDHLGSPRINTNEDGTVVARHDYRPYGEEIPERTHPQYAADTIRKQFTGYERDNETELDFAQARMYSSKLGRFTSADDFTNDTKITDTKSWNLYAYVRNNPLTLTDPNGEEVYAGNITDQKDKDEFLKRANYTYGCKSCVSIDKNGYVRVDTTGLSKDIIKATQYLTDAIHWLTSKQMMKLVIEKKPISSGTIGKNNLQGTVTMKVLLDSNGDVLCVEAIKGHPIAKTLAVSAIHQWKFKAYKVKGKSVSVVGFLVVPYDLRK